VIFLLAITSIPTQTPPPLRHPAQFVTGLLIPWILRLDEEADHSPAPTAQIKNAKIFIFTSYCLMAWCLDIGTTLPFNVYYYFYYYSLCVVFAPNVSTSIYAVLCL
jgi:hypothetical protein